MYMSNMNIQKSNIVGFKRYLQHEQQPIPCKQFKTEENSQCDAKLRDLGIPPLLMASRNSNESIPSLNYEASMNQMKELLLLKQLKQIQYYTDFLKFKSLADLAAVQQEQISQRFHQENYAAKSFLVASRDNSANSCASFSTSASLSPMRNASMFSTHNNSYSSPAIASPIQMEIPKFADLSSPSKSKKMLKVSACKNYIALLCTGFARSMLVSDSRSALFAHLSLTIQHKRVRYSSLFEVSDEKLKEEVLDYIQKDICGKRIKKTNKGRDFKVRNTEELEVLLNIKQGDDEMTSFRKEVLKEMMEFFFVSPCYEEWLDKGMINEANKSFFLKNKMEIQKKFANPLSYKPHFDYTAGDC